MLSGNLEDFSLDDIFQFLALTKKSGALRIETEDSEGRVYFRDGEVVFALADVRRLQIGARLVAGGHLSEAQVRELIDQIDGGGAVAFVAALLTGEWADKEAVQACLGDQIRESIGRLLRLEAGQFNFDSAASPPEWSGPAYAGADTLSQAREQLRQWDTIAERLPSLDAPLSLVPSVSSETLSLSAAQWQLLTLIDGTRTACDIVDLTGQGEFGTCNLLAGLVAQGLVEVGPEEGRSQLEELVAARMTLRELEHATGGSAQRRTSKSSPSPTSSTPSEKTEETSAKPSGETSKRDEAGPPDPPPAKSNRSPGGRRDVNVDRAQMARELASLGLDDN